MAKRIYSVAQVNKYISQLISSEPFLSGITVKGEVSNLKYHSSGHIYFDLKDQSGKISAAMFRNYRGGLTYPMKEGDAVAATGDVGVYTRNGSYQLVAKHIEPAGEGDLYQKFEKLKKELEEMGMFAQEYKKPIPRYISHLGIVTAPTGAAVRDIIRIAKRRNPGIHITLFPAKVQGEGSAESVADAIGYLDRYGVDVIIAGRGGGSIEDLWAFNEEIVARAIFNCETPIISAVGHQTDTTIADFVADVRAATPSEAAEIAVFDRNEVIAELAAKQKRMTGIMGRRLDFSMQRADHIEEKLKLLHPKNKLTQKKERLAYLRSRLKNAMDHRMEAGRHRLSIISGRFEAVSPARKLSSGFAYISDKDGKNVKSISSVNESDELDVFVVDGRIRTKVVETVALKPVSS